MKSISYCSQQQVDWFDREKFFLELRPPLGIFRQENFDDDVKKILVKINAQSVFSAHENRSHAHKNDYSNILQLSEKAKEHIFAWYRQDFAFYEACEHWLAGASIGRRAGSAEQIWNSAHGLVEAQLSRA